LEIYLVKVFIGFEGRVLEVRCKSLERNNKVFSMSSSWSYSVKVLKDVVDLQVYFLLFYVGEVLCQAS